ncbi:MAG: right-handed parallel beta-helix repeat-containing protein [Phycisphaerales bacterium]
MMKLKGCGLLTATLAFVSGSCLAADFTVPSAETPTLQFALESPTTPVNAGDTITLLDSGFYLSTYTVSIADLTIKGAEGQNVVIDGLGLGSVITVSASGSGLTLENLTIQGGFDEDGGGIYAEDADLTLIDCTIRDNMATDDGGGMVVFNGDAVIVNSRFIDNELMMPNSSDNGGALHIGAGATLDIDGTIFSGNIANNYGGGIYFNNTTGTVTNCTFENNTARIGGALGFVSGADPVIFDSIMESNNATEDGGAIGSLSAFPTFFRSTILRNTAVNRGGGVYASGETSNEMSLTNCLIAKNTAGSSGGGLMAFTGPDIDLLNCTIVDNTVTSGIGGGIWDTGTGAGTQIFNCIVRGNSPDQFPMSGTNNAFDSNVENDLANNTRIIDVNPMFVDPSNDDYRLMAGSASIDAGDSNRYSTEASPVDLDGNARAVTVEDSAQMGLPLLGLLVDHGAYEFQPAGSGPACVADLTGEGQLNFLDVSAFLAAFADGCP